MVKPKIVFKELGLQNFGPFVKYQSFEFSRDPDKNVTLIKGGNNTGKTSLFQGLIWTLLPETNEELRENEMTHLRSLETINVINIETIKNTKIGDEIIVKGVVEFTYITGSKNTIDYFITRTRKYRKKKDFDPINYSENYNSEVLEYVPNSDSTVVTKNGKNLSDINDYFKIINNFIPPAIRTFVFIHGEGMTRILSIENVAKLRDSVLSISDYDRINSLHSYLEACKEYFEKERKKLNTGNNWLTGKEAEIEAEKAKLKTAEGNLAINQGKLANYENEYLKTQDELDKLGKAQQLAKDYNDLKDDLKKEEKKKKELTKDRKNILMEYVPILYIESAIKLCREDIQRKRELGIIPGSLIPKEILKLILKNPNQCLCTTPWTKTMKDAVNKLIKDSYSTEVIAEVNKFEAHLDYMEENLTKGKIEIIKIEDKYTEKFEDIRKLNQKIENIERRLTPEQRESSWYKRIKDLNTKKDKFYKRMAIMEERIEKLEKEIEDINSLINDLEKEYTDYEKSLAKKAGGKDADYYLDICNQLEIYDQIGLGVLQNLEGKIREATRKETEKILINLVKNPTDWDSISINKKGKGWEINANHQGFQIVNLAGGMTNVLGLSFIFALSSILGVELPLIFDSPLVYLDEEVRELVCEKLPEIFKGRQIAFFVKNTEMTGVMDDKGKVKDLYPVLQKYIDLEYEIINPTEVNATIQKV